MKVFATKLIELFVKIGSIFFIYKQGKSNETSKTNNHLLNAHNRLQERLNKLRNKSNTK